MFLPDWMAQFFIPEGSGLSCWHFPLSLIIGYGYRKIASGTRCSTAVVVQSSPITPLVVNINHPSHHSNVLLCWLIHRQEHSKVSMQCSYFQFNGIVSAFVGRSGHPFYGLSLAEHKTKGKGNTNFSSACLGNNRKWGHPCL